MYILNKNFFHIAPLFIPGKRLIVIAYENIIEVLDWEHNIICKIEEQYKIAKLENCDNDKLKFIIVLQNGLVKLYDLDTKLATDVLQVENEIKNLFYYKENILTVEKGHINFYPQCDINQKREITNKALEIVAYSKKTGVIGMVEKSSLCVMSINSNKKLSHTLPKFNKKVTFTTVTCHPTENIVATGDSKGRIMIWHDVLNSLNKCTTYHWHFLSLNTIVFDHDGKHLLSGGHEQVLVKWEISVTNSDKKKTFLPRMESDIANIQTFEGDISEFYLVTLTDNSFHLVTNALRSMNKYSGLVQRSEFLHNKLSNKCLLNPVELKSCHKMSGKYQSCVLMNGHEGKLQFFDIYDRVTRFQLDSACQNWPTETENHLIPGFIQIQKAVISYCGRFLATYQSLGVSYNSFDSQRSLKIFKWDEDRDRFDTEACVSLDMFDKVSDILFHSNGDFIQLVTDSLTMISLQRMIVSNVPNWTICNVFSIEETLYHYDIEMDNLSKNCITKMVTSENLSSASENGLVFVSKGNYIIVFNWSDLAFCKSKPVIAVDIRSLATDLKMEIESIEKLNGAIVSLALFKDQKSENLYRIILGLQYGIMNIDMTVNADYSSVDFKVISTAISEYEIQTISPCPGSGQSNAQVAILFVNSSSMTTFNVWRDTSQSRILSVQSLESVTWVPLVNKPDQWTLVGLKKDNNLRSIVICEEGANQYFQQKLKSETKICRKNLLLLSEEIDKDLVSKIPEIKRGRIDRNFVEYDGKSAPSATLILYSMSKIK